MTILGLDLAKLTGWSLCHDGIILRSGVWDLGAARDDHNGHNGHIFEALYRNIVDGDHFIDLDVLAYEVAHHRGGPAVRIAVGTNSIVLMVAAMHDLKTVPVHTATLKKFATGNYRAGKDDMVAEASRRVNRRVESDDEADAILISLYAHQQLKEKEDAESKPEV